MEKEKTLILIDDHAMMRHGLADFISKSSDWRVVGEAASVAEGEHLIEKEKPTIALVDIRLDQEDGLSILQHVVQNKLVTKVIMYSMFSSPGLVKRALDYGAKGYVTKSAEEKEIIEALNTVYAGKTYVEKRLDENLQELNTVLAPLTAREQLVFFMVQQGKSDAAIARELGITEVTARNYLSRLCDKLGVSGREGVKQLLGAESTTLR